MAVQTSFPCTQSCVTYFANILFLWMADKKRRFNVKRERICYKHVEDEARKEREDGVTCIKTMGHSIDRATRYMMQTGSLCARGKRVSKSEISDFHMRNYSIIVINDSVETLRNRLWRKPIPFNDQQILLSNYRSQRSPMAFIDIKSKSNSITYF